jgi:uncharacterized radical SAM superfamily Fe-S cluster-containing enzyme
MKNNEIPNNSSIKLLKKTKSICPKCLKVIDADIFEKKDGIWMYKECDEHGKFKGLVEKDVEFYKKVMNEYPVKRKSSDIKLMIPFTHKCNMNCNFCWLPQNNREDFSTEDLKKIISESKCKSVRLSGGEPTIRNDLMDILRFIKKNKKDTVLMTNGLRLANLDYVKKLKDADLDGICISFNSFDDDVYKKLNGKKLLNVKLKALENLKKVGISTTLSFMIHRGVNDKELKKIFDYCIENNSFIKELRIRNSSPIGKYIKSNGFFISDMITTFSKITNIDRREFIDVIDKNRHMTCSYSGIIISCRENDYISPWELFDITKIVRSCDVNCSLMDKILLSFKMLSKIKINTLFKIMMNEKKGKNLRLVLEFRSWPNKYNIDLGDMDLCPTYQLAKNGKFPFCYSLILNDENAIEL